MKTGDFARHSSHKHGTAPSDGGICEGVCGTGVCGRIPSGRPVPVRKLYSQMVWPSINPQPPPWPDGEDPGCSLKGPHQSYCRTSSRRICPEGDYKGRLTFNGCGCVATAGPQFAGYFGKACCHTRWPSSAEYTNIKPVCVVVFTPSWLRLTYTKKPLVAPDASPVPAVGAGCFQTTYPSLKRRR